MPRNRTQIYRIYGNPGAGSLVAAWERASIVKVTIPGVPGHVRIHRLVEPYLREAIRRALKACPLYRITKVGGFVFRHQRHDPALPLSMHAFGCAVDIDPHRNQAKQFVKRAPEAWSERWKEEWPDGLPPEFVEAFRSVGWAWGADWDQDGDTEDHAFSDPMHFELVHRGRGPALAV